jgi:hypothetical protein
MSKGDFNTATTLDFSTDVEAALQYLQTRKEIDNKKIGLIGHSEGGIIAPMVANKSKNISFIILLAGTGIPGDELLLLNGDALSPTAFVPGTNRVQVSSDGVTSREVTIEVPVQSVMRAFVDASAASARVLDLQSIGKRIAYYRIWAARDQIQRNFQQEMENFSESNIDALIIDLRGGFGGTSDDYLSAVRFMRVQNPVPVYFLIDDSVRSGKELLAALVRRDGLGTLVGSTTAGYYLSGRMNRLLENRYFLYVAVGTFPTPGTGDIEVEFSLASREPVTVMLKDREGHTLLYDEQKLEQGPYKRTIAMSAYPTGDYYIVIEQQGKSFAKQLVKYRR